MLKILILEDEEYRIKWFKQATIGYSVEFVKTAADAVKSLSEKTFDYCYLDNDLDEKSYDNYRKRIICDKTTGYAVCLFLKANPELNKDCQFVVHTLNDLAQKLMMEALVGRNACQISFLDLISKENL